jgi:hypothetical protein
LREPKRRPGKAFPAVSDGDDRIVEDALNVRDAVSNVLAYFANALGSAVIDDFTAEDLSIISSGTPLRGPLRACIGAGALALKSTPMAETSVATDVHQALDIHRGFTTQVTLNGEQRSDHGFSDHHRSDL